MGAYTEPHGGVRKHLYVSESVAATKRREARDVRSWDLTERQLCDIELILNGAFSPLEGFMTKQDYEGVLNNMRLASGTLWPIPVVLDVTPEFAESTSEGETIALLDREGVLIALMRIEAMWTPNRETEAEAVFGTTDTAHPGVDDLLRQTHPVYVGGPLEGVEPPTHYDFRLLRDSPMELRGRFRKLGWRKVVAFHTRQPMHRAQFELTVRAARDHEANLLIQPVVGLAKPGDVEHYARVRCYEQILKQYPEQTTTLSLLNLAMRMAGPREALWHAIIRKNHGCTHFIVERDHASPGERPDGHSFYAPDAAQELCTEYEDELDVTVVPLPQMVYVESKAQYMPVDEIGPDMKTLGISTDEFRRRLEEGLEIPEWFSCPDVVAELRKVHPPRHEQGFTVFFTGLSGAGKSTMAKALLAKLLEVGPRAVTLLDGDIVRKNLSRELGFSKEHRDLNIQRIGYVAAEITKSGGVALCAPIAPYAATRRSVRKLIEPFGGFIEVHVATPLEVCEKRDRKGLYAKARAGLIKDVTGISDPYEEPEHPEMRVDTVGLSADLAAHRILVKLESLGYIR